MKLIFLASTYLLAPTYLLASTYLVTPIESSFHPFNEWPLYQVPHQEYFCESRIEVASHLICCAKRCYDSDLKRNLTTYHISCKLGNVSKSQKFSQSNETLNPSVINQQSQTRQELRRYQEEFNCTVKGFNERAYFEKRASDEDAKSSVGPKVPPILQRMHDQAKWHFRLFFIWIQRKFYKFLALQILPKGFLAG